MGAKIKYYKVAPEATRSFTIKVLSGLIAGFENLNLSHNSVITVIG